MFSRLFSKRCSCRERHERAEGPAGMGLFGGCARSYTGAVEPLFGRGASLLPSIILRGVVVMTELCVMRSCWLLYCCGAGAALCDALLMVDEHEIDDVDGGFRRKCGASAAGGVCRCRRRGY
eukprot:59250-Pyramimonas_sp.AAC.1